MLKKILFSLGALAALLITVVSCSREEIYSCDPVVNQWTKNNLESIRTMTRSNFVAVNDVARQRAIYNALTQEQRIEVWTSKINDILSFDWSAEEKSHLEALKTLINDNPKFFSDDNKPTEEENDAFNIALFRWVDYAETTLNWSEMLINNIIYTPLTIGDKEGNIVYVADNTPMLMSTTEGGGGGGGTPTTYCDCRGADRGCPGTCDNNYSCKGSDMGCGALWSEACTGKCFR